MADYDNIRSVTEVEDWIKRLRAAGRKPKTEVSYLTGLVKYMEYTGMTPAELLEEAETEEAQRIPMRKRKSIKSIEGFQAYLEKHGTSPNTARNALNGALSFYRNSYLEIPKLVVGRRTVEPMPKNNKRLGKENIKEILKYCDPLEKALVLVGVASGLSAADIINLRVRDFVDNYDPETGITTLDLIRIKTKVRFVTFLNPEASNAVRDYLTYRERQPNRIDDERLSQTEKQRMTHPNGWLFVNKHVPDAYLDIQPEENYTTEEGLAIWQERENLRQFNDNSFPHLYAALSAKCQKSTPNGTWNVVRSHNMRKLFKTILTNKGMSHFDADRMMGHKMNAVDSAYNEIYIADMREKYRQHMHWLTIQEHVDVSVSPAFIELNDKFDELKKESAGMAVEREDYNELKAQCKYLEENVVELMMKLTEERLDPETKARLARLDKITADMFDDPEEDHSST